MCAQAPSPSAANSGAPRRRDRAFPHGRGGRLDDAAAHVATGEHTRQTGLREGRARAPGPSAARQLFGVRSGPSEGILRVERQQPASHFVLGSAQVMVKTVPDQCCWTGQSRPVRPGRSVRRCPVRLPYSRSRLRVCMPTRGMRFDAADQVAGHRLRQAPERISMWHALAVSARKMARLARRVGHRRRWKSPLPAQLSSIRVAA